MPRSAWTPTARGGAQLTGSKLVGLACHWPGSTTNAYGVETAAAVAGRLRGWRQFHVEDRGWADIGYNFAIDQAGRVWDLRGSSRVGAHCASAGNPDANHEYIGVLFVLGDQEQPTAAMTQAFWDFRRDVFQAKWPGRNDVRGHREVPGAQTSCPGNAVIALTNGRPTPPGKPTPPTTPPTADAMEDEVATGTIQKYGSSQYVHIVNGDVQIISAGTYGVLARGLVPHQDPAVSNDAIRTLIALQELREARRNGLVAHAVNAFQAGDDEYSLYTMAKKTAIETGAILPDEG